MKIIIDHGQHDFHGLTDRARVQGGRTRMREVGVVVQGSHMRVLDNHRFDLQFEKKYKKTTLQFTWNHN